VTAALRSAQNCPDWCEGEDHREVAVDLQDVPRHFRSIGYINRWQVTILRDGLQVGGPTYVELSGCDDDRLYAAVLDSGQARSVAAMLLRAADEIETNSGYTRA
jgi:hypothetical protein